jgi:hypothetical protein
VTLIARLALVCLLACAASASASDKKGVGLANLKGANRIAALNVAWYYTWRTQPIEAAPAEKFVPMVWSGKSRLDQHVAALSGPKKVPLLLTFNEPDQVKQANMSVDEALRAWPRLEALAERISSPAPAGAGGPWIRRFLELAQERSLRVDFLAVHLYVPADARRFLQRIDRLHEQYRLPIWITEFAVVDRESKNKPGTNRFSDEDVVRFMQEVLPELERRPYVERYAWFGASARSGESEKRRSSRLFEKDGSLSPAGRFYASFR